MAKMQLQLSSNVQRLGIWLLPLLLLLVLQQQQQLVEARYLPTRSHGDDLDKLRELMLQILESSNEDQRQQAIDGGNSAATNTNTNGNALPQHASWLSKLNSLEAAPRKYGGNRGGYYDTGRYY